jgi:PAS domain S-box-containing protein
MPNFSFGKSIKTQLIVVLFALTAISIGVIGFLGIRGVVDSGRKTGEITSASAQKRAEELLVQTTTATAEKNGLLFKNIEQKAAIAAEFTRNILDNPQKFSANGWRFDEKVSRLPTGQYGNSKDELGSVFLPSMSPVPAGIKKEFEITSYLDNLFPQMIADESNAVALYFTGYRNTARYYPNIGLAELTAPDFNITEQEFYTVANPKNDPEKITKWTSVYDDPAGNGLTITAGHPIYLKNKSFAGTIGMDVTLTKIAKNIEDYSPIESSYAFLVDSKGRAIALPEQGYADILGRKPKKGEFGPDLQKVKGDFLAVLKQMQAGKRGFTTTKAQNTDLYVAYAPLEATDFSLGIVAKKQVILKVVSDLESQVQKSTSQVLYLQILPFAVLILVLVWVFGFFYIRFITEPIIALTNKTNKIMQGSLNQEIDVKASNNEVGKLAEAFNKMIRELAASYKALEHKVVELGSAKAKDDAILNSIGDGVIVIDTEGKILLINAIAADVLGFDSGDDAQNVADRAILDAEGNVLENKDRPMRRAMAAGKKVKQEIVVQYTMGKKIVLDVTATPVVESEKTIGAIAILHDITKEKEVDRMKTEFITVASHQLRTPLSGIKWFSEMLLNGDAGKLENQQHEFVNNIHLSTDRMIQLVNSLLNISSLESGRIMVNPKPTNLKELVENTLKDLKAKSDERKQEVTLEVEEGLPTINIDAGLIGQVYDNLITNAVKYTPEGGKISIKVGRKGDFIMSQVKDTGMGVPADEQKKMFGKFFRGSNILQVDTDGTGLGLYLSKAIVESSNGQIDFTSKQDSGTLVWFTLPLEGMKARGGNVEDVTKD